MCYISQSEAIIFCILNETIVCVGVTYHGHSVKRSHLIIRATIVNVNVTYQNLKLPHLIIDSMHVSGYAVCVVLLSLYLYLFVYVCFMFYAVVGIDCVRAHSILVIDSNKQHRR
jgi:hypothetical protein